MFALVSKLNRIYTLLHFCNINSKSLHTLLYFTKNSNGLIYTAQNKLISNK